MVSLKDQQRCICPNWANHNHPQILTSWLGTGAQKIDHIEMMANMNEDLEFRHEGSVFTVCCSFYKYRGKREIRRVGITLGRLMKLCNFPSSDDTTVALFAN